MITALFDCDGTLFSAEMGRGLMRYASDNGRKWAARRYLTSLLPSYYLSKLGLTAKQPFRLKATSRLGWLMKGWDEDEMSAAFQWVTHNYLLPTQRDDVVQRLDEHRQKGHYILLVSGIFTACLTLLSEHYQANGMVGTGLEITNGRYTGRLSTPVINGAIKGEYILSHFSGQKKDVDWPNSYAYADSFHDQSMFDLVGHPVAVYPDPKLSALALEKGWETIPD